MSQVTHYLGYFLHEGVGSSSTRDVCIRREENGSYTVLSKIDQFSTGGMTEVLPIFDEVGSFSSARDLARFCKEESFDPGEIAEAMHSVDSTLSEELHELARDRTFFPAGWEPEHTRIKRKENLGKLLLERSGLSDLLVEPSPLQKDRKKEGKIVSFDPLKSKKNKE